MKRFKYNSATQIFTLGIGTMLLSCFVTSAQEPPKLDSEDLLGETDNVLGIATAAPTDQGDNTVRVRKSDGFVVSKPSTLSVLLPPTITAQPTSRTRWVGGTLTFTVGVSGEEPFSYQWRFRGKDLVGETNSRLMLDDIQIGYAGSYDVIVANSNGSATSQAAKLRLYITVNPPFNPGLTISSNGSDVSLLWSGEGFLERAAFLNGPWQSEASSNSSYTVQPTRTAGFFRLRNPHPRSARVFIPSSNVPGTPSALILLLHGLGQNGEAVEGLVRLLPHAESRGFVYCYPDGIRDNRRLRFWNATDACCNFFESQVDDSAYLRSLIEEITRVLSVDRKRIYLIGGSNGGFMAYRMACEHADLIAGIASIAGMTYLNETQCRPSEPVNILHIHGTSDDSVFYEGGRPDPAPAGFPPAPSAMESIQLWAGYNGCQDLRTDPEASMDLDFAVPGLDTVVARYDTYPEGGSVEVWSIQGGSHVPRFSTDFAPNMLNWLFDHPKP